MLATYFHTLHIPMYQMHTAEIAKREEEKQDIPYTNNVTLRGVRAIIVAVEKQ